MNHIVQILMKRDGLSKTEAKEIVRDVLTTVREMIGEGDFIGAEDVFQSELGLEPDYLLEAIM